VTFPVVFVSALIFGPNGDKAGVALEAQRRPVESIIASTTVESAGGGREGYVLELIREKEEAKGRVEIHAAPFHSKRM